MARGLRLPKGRIALPFGRPAEDPTTAQARRCALAAIKAGTTQREALSACSVMFRHSPPDALVKEARRLLRRKYGGIANADKILARARKRGHLLAGL